LTRFEKPVFDDGKPMWLTLNGQSEDGTANGQPKNLFSTTLNVLVSAIQKLSTVTVHTPGLKLYRGIGGEVNLPDHFFNRDPLGRRGMTDWAFCSTTSSRDKAISEYSGVGKKNPLLFEIETNCVDHGASVAEFSQYPSEQEFIFVP
jgi:hypothetical protein